MAFGNGPRIVTDGLVLALDASDRNSYVSGSTIWRDVSGNNNSGSLVNGPTFSSANGGSIVFDGVDDLVNCGNNSVLNLNTLTISFWFYTTVSALKEIILKNNNTNNGVGPYEVFQNNTVINFRLNSGNVTRAGNIPYVLNRWNHIAATYDLITMKTYINNILDIDYPYNSSLSTSTGNLVLGAYGNGNFPLSGRLASVFVYNRALSASEITQNYNATKTRFGS